MGEKPERPAQLGRGTLTTLGVLASAVSFACAATWWASSICNRLDNIERAVNKRDTDSITRQEIETWRLLLKAANTNLQVPEVPR